MIEVERLSKSYRDTTAVDAVSFRVAEGELLALVGGSGSGKTTTLKMINRLVEPTAGQVLIDGEDASQIEPHALRRRIGYVFQGVGLFPHMTVAENVGVPLTRDRLQQSFLALRRQLRMTAVFVTHDMAEAVLVADRIGVMREGRLVQTGTPAELMRAPADEAVAHMLDTPRRQARVLESRLGGPA